MYILVTLCPVRYSFVYNNYQEKKSHCNKLSVRFLYTSDLMSSCLSASCLIGWLKMFHCQPQMRPTIEYQSVISIFDYMYFDFHICIVFFAIISHSQYNSTNKCKLTEWDISQLYINLVDICVCCGY